MSGAPARRRILLSEGSSTSAREAITALGLAGHHIEICDPDAHCLGRFSRFVGRFHRCPGLGVDPAGYRDFILDLVARERFDVLLPIHEQGFLFAKIAAELKPLVACALPSFEAYARVHSKLGFSEVLAELGLAQPHTAVVRSGAELLAAPTPVVVKLPIGTASRGIWVAETQADLERIAAELDTMGAFAEPVLVQRFAEGATEHAQAVFAQGGLVGCHGYRQLVRGLGGGEALKESVVRPQVRTDLARLGRTLGWHGALSVDYILSETDGPLYIDCNPRLVEPMSARLAGLDLADLLVRISLGDMPAEAPPSRPGDRTQLALQGVLGAAARSGSRRAVACEAVRLAFKRGPYRGAREELTPFWADPPSVIPTVGAFLWVLTKPGAAAGLAKGGWGAHLLHRDAAAEIAAWRS